MELQDESMEDLYKTYHEELKKKCLHQARAQKWRQGRGFSSFQQKAEGRLVYGTSVMGGLTTKLPPPPLCMGLGCMKVQDGPVEEIHQKFVVKLQEEMIEEVQEVTMKILLLKQYEVELYMKIMEELKEKSHLESTGSNTE